MKKEWVVYSKKPFDGAKSVLSYLGRYTHRIAISNNRILDCKNDLVTFRWRDYAHGNKVKIMELKSDEFIRRFLSHTLPHRFTRIRSFGFLANACKKNKTVKIRNKINGNPVVKINDPALLHQEDSIIQIMKKITGIDISQCLTCKKGIMRVYRSIASFQNCRAPPS